MNQKSAKKEKITGIGGFFFRAKDPDALGKWYEENFGINSTAGGGIWMQTAGPTAFTPFPENSDYFPSKQHCMMNFRVSDLDAMLRQLGESGVRIDENREDYSYGRFAWVFDPEGNRIELWEPVTESS